MRRTAALVPLSLLAASLSFGAPKPEEDAPWKVEAAHGKTHRVAFTTDEGTWLTLDVNSEGTKIVFSLLGDLYVLPIAGGDATKPTHWRGSRTRRPSASSSRTDGRTARTI